LAAVNASFLVNKERMISSVHLPNPLLIRDN
jgi:hypothetical protein